MKLLTLPCLLEKEPPEVLSDIRQEDLLAEEISICRLLGPKARLRTTSGDMKCQKDNSVQHNPFTGMHHDARARPEMPVH